MQRAGDRHPGFHRLPLAHGENVEAGVVERPGEQQFAALDLQPLTQRGVDPAHGAQGALRAQRAFRGGAHCDFAREPRVQSAAANLEIAAKVDHQVEQRARQARLLLCRRLAPGDDDIITGLGQGVGPDFEMAFVGAHSAGER
ncbi:hypothetical protein D3C83_12400 [compost metagenome]